jgi:hypothetical protein
LTTQNRQLSQRYECTHTSLQVLEARIEPQEGGVCLYMARCTPGGQFEEKFRRVARKQLIEHHSNLQNKHHTVEKLLSLYIARKQMGRFYLSTLSTLELPSENKMVAR